MLACYMSAPPCSPSAGGWWLCRFCPSCAGGWWLCCFCLSCAGGWWLCRFRPSCAPLSLAPWSKLVCVFAVLMEHPYLQATSANVDAETRWSAVLWVKALCGLQCLWSAHKCKQRVWNLMQKLGDLPCYGWRVCVDCSVYGAPVHASNECEPWCRN